MPRIDAVSLAEVPSVPFRGDAYRHVSPQHDPRSGEGARIHGGRFNPPESFPVLYLCVSRACVVSEFVRLGAWQTIGAEGLLPRKLFRFDAELVRVLDLTDEDVRRTLKVEEADLVDHDRTLTREIGVNAHGLSLQGILSPSATGTDSVLAVFPEHLGTSTLEPELVEEWRTLGHLEAPR